ncbi:glycosyltransferase family 4 protein [Marinomonas sp. PE14-40]|uniref:glycosyltransferase family 4 protein n=1 Tax=Marinomonas sp. PE14-40 TaxID=3060621 RepID=UPI003F66792D
MKICINAFSALRGGGQTYIANFLRSIEVSDELEIYLLLSKDNFDQFSYLKNKGIKVYLINEISKSIFHRVYWELFSLPRFLKDNGIERYYAPGGIMVTPLPSTVKTVTALRNMLPFSPSERKKFPALSYIRYKLLLLKFIYLISYKMADKVIFISETSKKEVLNYLPSLDSKAKVIPHGINKNLLNTESAIDERLVNQEYYLYVSILDYYKGQLELIKAWKKLIDSGFTSKLVLIGQNYNKYGEKVFNLIIENGLEDSIILLGAVDHQKLSSYYKSAKAHIFSSSCECCPNILLEKMSSGVPILCSDVAPMPEFGGDALHYFNPRSIDSIVSAVKFFDSNEGYQKELSTKAFERSKKFDWEKTSRDTINYIIG